MRTSKDNVINAVCIFGIIVAICIMLIVMLKSFYKQEIDIAFIKDIFSIGATLAAALIAISLFNDWKELEEYKHNSKLLENINSDSIKFINELRAFAYLPSQIKNGTNILINNPTNTFFTEQKIESLLSESLDYRMKNLHLFSSLRISLTRYIKYTETKEMDVILENLKSAAILFSSKNSTDMQQKNIIVNENKDLIDLIKDRTKELEEDLLPILDRLMSVKNWK